MPRLTPPIDFKKWIDAHREQLKPPVCNKQVFEESDFIVMVVGGPNSRKDYHVDEGPEFFYQLEGDMLLKTIQAGKLIDIPIREGEIFLLPPKLPHSPQRFADTLGLVIERKRLAHEHDGLQWYCEHCDHLLYEEFFHLEDVEKDFPLVFDHFFSSLAHRTCSHCGAVMPAPGQ
jgi:3-hydroxyanthranilate 3,4-dioxygenase